MAQYKYIALIGLGRWGKNILRNLIEIGVVHSVCEINVDVIDYWKEKYSDIQFTNSFEKIISDPKIEGIVISTPSNTHYQLVKSALQAGKDVFVEKPLALNKDEGDELVVLAERNKLILMVGHILLYHPGVLKLKHLISEGQLGKIQYIYSNRLNIGPLSYQENILWSYAPHDISAMIFLVNDEPYKVQANSVDYFTKGVYDSSWVSLEFPTGIKGFIFVSCLHPFKEQRLVVVGSRGMAVFDDVSNDKLKLYPYSVDWVDGKIPQILKKDYQQIEIENYEPLKLELQSFIECMHTRKSPITNGLESIKVLRILEMAEKSISQNHESKL